MNEVKGVLAVHAHKGWGQRGMWAIQPMTLNDISCNLGTKLSLGLNCYCTGVYIHTKPALGVALLVPPMLLSILHTYTWISSISTLLFYHILSPPSEGHIGKREWSEGSRNGNPQSIGSFLLSYHHHPYVYSMYFCYCDLQWKRCRYAVVVAVQGSGRLVPGLSWILA